MVFAMATYGEGEPTDNSHVFFKWAKAAAKDDGGLLAGAKFAVFGLGNTQYQHFNAMGKLTDELLAALGGERCADLGLGDDDADLEADFDAWRERLWSALCGSGGAADDGGAVALDFDVVFGGATTAAPLGASTKFYADNAEAAVLATRELRAPADGGSTLHLELDAADLPYETADNLAILPANAPADVAAVAGALGLDLNASFALAAAAAKAPFPTPCGVREALTSYCDLTAAPKRANLAALVAAAGGDAPGLAKDAWAAWAAAVPGPPTLAAALVALGPSIPADAPREAVLAALVLKACPRLQPRYYTISSSAVADPGRVHVTCAVATLPPDGAKAGVCSATLAGAAVGATIRAFVRPSSFRAPPAGKPAPVVLIGPGTGVAPMRAILRERAAALAAGDETAAWGSARKHKVYVQDLLRRDAGARASPRRQGPVYVCGGTAMGAAVAEALADVLAPKLGSRSDAKADVDDMQKTGRYVQGAGPEPGAQAPAQRRARL
ncbi:NADPH-hemoprotein reductase [Aureococcus anophagefferens]|nr:NADPH-hemoprotein reductase [Aureococcus anophagefferens]